MKLLCEFKKDSARCDKITFGYSRHDITGEWSDYTLFESGYTDITHAASAFSLHLLSEFKLFFVSLSILRRCSSNDSGLCCFVLIPSVEVRA
jgi:hypothetical protein